MYSYTLNAFCNVYDISTIYTCLMKRQILEKLLKQNMGKEIMRIYVPFILVEMS